MITRLPYVTIFVRDQDEALRFYTETLGLEKRADIAAGKGSRWITVAPKGQVEPEIVLETTEEPAKQGEVTPRWVFITDNCHETYESLLPKGVHFIVPPQEQPWGVHATFEDLSGNQFVLLEPKTLTSSR